MCGIELVRARCDRFLVIRLSGCLPLPLCPAAYCTGSVEEGGWGGWEAERWKAEVCLSRRRTQCNCVQPPAVQIVYKGNRFSCGETFPHVNLSPPPPCVFFRCFVCSLRPLSPLLYIHNVTFFVFNPFFIPLLPWNVEILPLESQ